MDFQSSGKKALVLASTSGLGFAIAKTFASEGIQVALCGRDERKLADAVKNVPNSEGFQADLSTTNGAEALMENVLKKWGNIGILVTHSPGPPKGLFHEIKHSDWQVGFQGLFLSPLTCIQKALVSMKEKKWGRIMLITATAAKEPIPKLTVSNALRPGLLGLANSLSKECAPFHVTVNAVIPGYTKTEGLMHLNLPEKVFVDQIPMNRLSRPEEIGALSTFLASEEASFITGQAIACDGGMLQGI